MKPTTLDWSDDEILTSIDPAVARTRWFTEWRTAIVQIIWRARSH